MPLDPQAKNFVDAMDALGQPALWQLEPAEARRAVLEGWPPIEPDAVEHVEDRAVPSPDGDIPVRIYTPAGTAPCPALVYFHGGGWVLCSIETHDNTCRQLANAAGCKVISVEYRLAPEHKFPAAAEDAYAAAKWVYDHAGELEIDRERIAVGGDSAGGNLAAVAALMARDRGGPPLVFQLLIYPATDYRFDTPSYRENAEGYFFLTKDAAVWYWNHYLRDEADGRDPYAAPMRADDLGGLPPALVITAEFDPLRDDGELYGARLRESGVPTTIARYDGMIHGFFSMTAALDKAKVAVAEAGAALRRAFSAQPVGD